MKYKSKRAEEQKAFKERNLAAAAAKRDRRRQRNLDLQARGAS